jgi:PLD-like domain
MNRILSGDLWTTVSNLARKSKIMRAAIAYVSADKLIEFGKGDTLIVDASDEAIASGQTSATTLAKFHTAGAELYSLTNLHAKVLLLDRYAIVGSANLSARSEQTLVEAALLTDEPSPVTSTLQLIRQLQRRAILIDSAFIKRIKFIAVTQQNRAGSSERTGERRVRIRVGMPRTWFICLWDFTLKEWQKIEKHVEKGKLSAQKHLTSASSDIMPMRFTGTSRFRREAQRGDLIIWSWRKEADDSPVFVYRHSPLLSRQNRGVETLFFVERFADVEQQRITWKQFQQLKLQVGIKGRIGAYSDRELTSAHSDALHALWPKRGR